MASRLYSRIAFAGLVASAVSFTGCGDTGTQSAVVQPSWSGTAHDIIFDHHLHTRFSDGGLKLRDVAELAAKSGCTAIVFSDHSDSSTSYGADYFAALDAARSAHPALMIFGGLELEMPSYDGREHLGLIAHPRIERELIPAIGFTVEAVAASQSMTPHAMDQAVLRPVERTEGSADALLIYNHPSRKDRASGENLTDHSVWSDYSGRTLLLSGAPGHQKAQEAGDYRPPILTRHRWDPVVAEVGGAWDRLLDEGKDVWGAIAASDFHSERKDYPPCTFAKTHIAAADNSYSSVLEALAAGTFWAGHGDVLEDLQLSAELDMSTPLAYPGSIISLAAPDEVPLIRLAAVRGTNGTGVSITAEFISNCTTGAPERVAIRKLSETDTDTTFFLPVASAGSDGRSCYLRARVAATVEGERLMAYTNPIRLVLPI